MSPLPVFAIDQFVEQEGEVVKHFIGKKCFCIGLDGQPDPNCDLHEVGGFRFTNEREIIGLVSSIKYDHKFVELGIFDPSDCIFSPTSTDLVSEGDKIVFTWPLPHGSGDVLTRTEETFETLTYAAVKSINCEDEDGVEYVQDVDFRFNGNLIEWEWPDKDGAAPAFDKKYAIKYTAFIEWIAFMPPSPRIWAGEDTGAKVFLRKKHLLFR